ncbi:MAG TPA: AAA family ATPase [Clostridia bacterium]|nr:AAA family ATPase [Clostridia bacterium]
MKIDKLKVNGFGRINDREFSFSDRMNLVYGKNEAGKSTLMNFIKAMLYGFTNQRTDGEGRPSDKARYKPWDSPNYSGYIELYKDNGKKIRIEKDFETNETQVFDENLVNISGNFEHQPRTGLKVGENLLGIDRECFESSVFIGQGGTSVSQNDRNHLFERIVNIMNTGAEDESASAALAAVSKAQKNLGHSRTQDKPYNKAVNAVNTLEKEFRSAVERNSDMERNMERKQFLEEEIERLESALKVSEAVRKADITKGKIRELENTRKRYMNISDEINSLEKELYNSQNIHAKLNSAGAKEKDVLRYMQRTASSSEKLKGIPKGDHKRELQKLEAARLRKRIAISLLLLLAALSIIPSVLFSPFIFIMTALLTLAVIPVLMQRSHFSKEQLQKYISLGEECSGDLDEINDFITTAGCKRAIDFHEAEEILNSLYHEINEKVSLESIMENTRSRISGQKALANEILGSFDSIKELDAEIAGLSSLVESSGQDMNTDSASPEDLRKKLVSSREEIAGIKRLLDEFFHDEEALAEIEERLASAREHLDSINIEREALQLTETLIKESAESLRGNIFPVINEKMGTLISRITNQRHSLLLAGLGKTMNTEFNDMARTIWNFSDGTIDQMYLSLRLAAADAISENESLPIMIDEAFAFYDEERIEAAFELLHDLSADHQIIIFTCKESELAIAHKLKDVNIIEL